MRASRRLWWLSLGAVGALTAVLAAREEAPEGRRFEPWEEEGEEEGEAEGFAAPTEIGQGEGEEGENRGRREAWFEEMHRAPPGVDWRAAERENGRRLMERRNRLAGAPRPPAEAPRWVERGSDNQAGSTHVTRRGTDPDVLYVGSDLGGLWKGWADGSGWEPIGDNLYGGVHWLEVLPPAEDGGADTLVVATNGGSVHRTTDDGATWSTPTGLDGLNGVRRLLVTTDGSDRLFLVGNTGAGTFLFRSTDAGASFTSVYTLGGPGDAWAPRDGRGGLWVFGASGLARSDDGGDNWTLVGNPGPTWGSAELAGSEAGAPQFYLALDGANLWRSRDGGATWRRVNDLSDYWGALNASIVDPDLFVYGGMELKKTWDGGDSFSTQNYWWEYYGAPETLLHADMMGVDVWSDGAGGEVWYVNCHGGTYQSTDQFATVENLSMHGLRVSQYYGTLTSAANPEHVAAGAQDQGYQWTNGVAQDGDDVLDFVQPYSGDYGHLTSSDGTHAYVYSVYPGFVLIQKGEEKPQLFGADFPPGESYVPWLPPIVADPDKPKAFFFPASHLYYYDGVRESWSPALWSDHNFASGSGEYISALAFSPLDSMRMWVTTNWGRILWSTDKGKSWTESAFYSPDENWLYGNAIWASRVDPELVYLGGSGYGAPAVYRSTDGGRSWRPWGEGLPDTLVYTLVESRDGKGTMYVGTQTAAYRREADGTAWEEITGADAPITIYWDSEALVGENTIRFATYGRGIWDYQADPAHTGCYPVQDYDGDGKACDEDCDDHDAAVFPGAADDCDGVDHDCDPATPDEVDHDGDGFYACADCDDADRYIAPGATEVCGDGIDQDCSGADLACVPPDGEDSPPPDEETGAEDKGGGCACGTAPEALPGAALLLLAAAALRRRRA